MILRIVFVIILLILPEDAACLAPAPIKKTSEAKAVAQLRKSGIALTFNRRDQVVGASLSSNSSDADFSLLTELPHLTDLQIHISTANTPTISGLMKYDKLRQLRTLIVWDSSLSEESYQAIKSKLQHNCLFFNLPD